MGRKWWKRKVFTNPLGAAIDTVKAVARNPLKEVFKVTGAVTDFVVDDIIDPIVKLADDVVQAALSDPIGTIAKIYAVSTGQFYLLPYIAAASTAINGGNLGDIVKAAAISYVAGEVATGVGNYVGTAGTAAEYGVSVGSSQASQLALQEAGMGSVVSITNSIAASSAGNAAAAVVLGQDPIKAFVSGGISAGVPAALGQVDGFVQLQKTNPAVANVITKAITTELQGGDVSAATLNAVIISSEIAAKAINTFDPQKKMTDAERAVATNLIINTTTAAVKGGDITAAMNATLVSSAVNSLGKIVTGDFKTKVATATKNYESASDIAEKITASDARQSELIADYNNIAAQFDIRSDEQARLQKVDADNRAKYDAMVKSGATNEQLNTQAALINTSTDALKTYASDFSKYVDENKPALTTLKTEIDTLTKTETTLQTDLTKTLENQLTLTKPISAVTDIATDVLNESFTKAIDPSFNAKEYAEINGLDAGANAYTDFMEKGRDAGVPTNFESARAEITSERTQLITKVLASQGLTLDNADPEDVSKLIDSVDAKYGNNLAKLRGASIQDVISGNTKTIESIAKEPWRVDISGSAYGDWKKPDEKTFKVPEGFKLATTEQFESKQADKFLADDGQAVWLVPDGTAKRTVWNDKTGKYEEKPIEIKASKPNTADVYSVAAVNNPDDASVLTSIAAYAATGLGQQIETWSNAMTLQFGGDMKNTTTKLGKTLQEWGAANTPSQIIAQMKATDAGLKAATSKGNVYEQTVAVAKLAKQNTGAFVAYIASEWFQEALPIGAGLVAAGVAAYLGAPLAVGVASATAIATIIDGIEVFGSSGKEVYDARIKAGDSEAEARSKASLAGFKAALVTAPANALANAAMFIPYMKTLGTIANTALQGARGVAASAAGEYFETFTQSVITQAAINPDAPFNYADAHVKSVFATMISAGTSGVILAPSVVDGSLAIGFDDAGQKVTYADLQGGSPKVNLSKLDTSVVVGKSSDGKNVTLGDLITSDAAATSGTAVSGVTGDAPIPTQIDSLIDPLVTDEAEARAAFKAIGYTPTQAEVDQYVGKIKESVNLPKIETTYNPLVTTPTEAMQIAKDLGYTNITPAEAAKLAGQFKETDAKKTIAKYVDDHSVTATEAKDLLVAAGIKNPTPAEISKFVGSGATIDAAKIKADLEAYADPFAVSEQEAVDIYKSLGLNQPTKADIDKLIGNYAETELLGKATKNLPDAKINTVLSLLDSGVAGTGVDSAEIKRIIDAAMAENPQLTEDDIADIVSGKVTDIEKNLADLTKSTAEQYASLSDTQKDLADALVDQGKTLSDAIADAKASTTEQIETLATDVQEKYNSLSDAQKDLAQDLVDQGKTLEEAIADVKTSTEASIDTLSKDVQAKYDTLTDAQKDLADSLVAQGGTLQAAVDAAQASTASQIAGVTEEMRAQYDTLTAAQKATADALVAQGETFQSALALAQATTAGQIGDLSADVQAKYDALTASQKDTADALVQQGQTLQAAIDAAQTTTAGQISGLTADMQTKFDALTAEQQKFALDLVALGNTTQAAITAAQNATTEQINSSTTALNTRIDQLIAEGKTQQEASKQALAEVSGKLGTQGRAPNQSDLDTLEQMITGTIPVDTAYDVNQDGKITPADLDFLTNLVKTPNVNEPYKPLPGSPWAPTGLYAELEGAKQEREKDRIRLEEQRIKDLETQKIREAEAAKAGKLQSAKTATARALQKFGGTAPTLLTQATQEVSTPIYGQAIKEFDFGAPLDYSFFEPSKEKQDSQTGQQTTKIATGGYLDDLLAENMTVDDLLKLLR